MSKQEERRARRNCTRWPARRSPASKVSKAGHSPSAASARRAARMPSCTYRSAATPGPLAAAGSCRRESDASEHKRGGCWSPCSAASGPTGSGSSAQGPITRETQREGERGRSSPSWPGIWAIAKRRAEDAAPTPIKDGDRARACGWVVFVDVRVDTLHEHSCAHKNGVGAAGGEIGTRCRGCVRCGRRGI